MILMQVVQDPHFGYNVMKRKMSNTQAQQIFVDALIDSSGTLALTCRED